MQIFSPTQLYHRSPSTDDSGLPAVKGTTNTLHFPYYNINNFQAKN